MTRSSTALRDALSNGRLELLDNSESPPSHGVRRRWSSTSLISAVALSRVVAAGSKRKSSSSEVSPKSFDPKLPPSRVRPTRDLCPGPPFFRNGPPTDPLAPSRLPRSSAPANAARLISILFSAPELDPELDPETSPETSRKATITDSTTRQPSRRRMACRACTSSRSPPSAVISSSSADALSVIASHAGHSGDALIADRLSAWAQASAKWSRTHRRRVSSGARWITDSAAPRIPNAGDPSLTGDALSDISRANASAPREDRSVFPFSPERSEECVRVSRHGVGPMAPPLSSAARMAAS